MKQNVTAVDLPPLVLKPDSERGQALTLRPLTEQDLVDNDRLENELYPHTWSIDDYLVALSDPAEHCYIAYSEGQVVGMGGYEIIKHKGVKHGCIIAVGITKSWQGMGYGRALFRFLIACCEAEGCQALHLEVDDDNIKAQHLYESEGFVFNVLLKDWYGPGSRTLRMTRGSADFSGLHGDPN
jgi:ribosomal protein S18 acetylase RimI-like enzyme